MRISKVIQLCASWHNGASSALYSFASTGEYRIELHLLYLKEIEDCLHPEYALHPGILSKKNEGDLKRLKLFFIETGIKNGIVTIWGKHPLYGYEIPYLSENTPTAIVSKVEAPRYAI